MIRPFKAKPGYYQHGDMVGLKWTRGGEPRIIHVRSFERSFIGTVDAPSGPVIVKRGEPSPLVQVKMSGFAADVVRAVAA